MFSRIVAEFILIVFRINEHLGAIRDQGADAVVLAYREQRHPERRTREAVKYRRALVQRDCSDSRRSASASE